VYLEKMKAAATEVMEEHGEKQNRKKRGEIIRLVDQDE
jgi:hypothetical protein